MEKVLYEIHLRQQEVGWLGTVFVRNGARLDWIGASKQKELVEVMEKLAEIVEEQEGEKEDGH